ncbi:MAG: TIGR00159 family protein [Acidobacteria bacterium]|nr:TIGR00159 family protein [Acidobacteriota bacterium]MBI3656521.1 TIGR00159 family protein [Acidobacteriota bacterium]
MIVLIADTLLSRARISHIEPKDVIDILIVAFLIYRVLLLIRGTRGVQITIAIILMVLFYYLTQLLQLEMVQWLFTHLLTYIAFALIVVYSPTIRRVLTNLGRYPFLRQWTEKLPAQAFEEIVLAATTLSTKQIGGLIVVEGEVGLKNYIETGIKMDALLTYDLLVTIFSPYTPLHDGAVIIQGDRVAAAACFLPLTLEPQLSKELGTRHRAAIGITEETDAVAVVISEETGIISAVVGGKMHRPLDGDGLRNTLVSAMETKANKT